MDSLPQMNVLIGSPHPGKIWRWALYDSKQKISYEAPEYPIEFFDLQAILSRATGFIINSRELSIRFDQMGYVFDGIFIGDSGKIAWIQTRFLDSLTAIIDELKVRGWTQRELNEYPYALELQAQQRGKWVLWKPEE